MKIHVINVETMVTYCGKGVYGDKAITLEDARDMTNNLFFDCEDCYKILSDDNEAVSE